MRFVIRLQMQTHATRSTQCAESA